MKALSSRRATASLVLTSILFLVAGAAARQPALRSPMAEAGGPITVVLDAVADTWVNAADPTRNYGTRPELEVALGPNSAPQVTLVIFDVRGIPQSAVVEQAELQLYQSDAAGLSAVDLTANRCDGQWRETTVNWVTRPPLQPTSVTTVGVKPGWKSWNVTKVVEGWVAGTSSNYGFAVDGPITAILYGRSFTSREQGTAPRLEVTYSVASPTPTPTPTATPTATPTPTPTATPTPTPTPTPGPCPDPYEPNESFADAWSLEPLDPHGILSFICSAGDDDYFSFSAELADEIDIRLGQLTGNYDLELYDPLGVKVAESRHGGTTPERITLRVFEVTNVAGEFRARVFSPGGDSNPGSPYRLLVEAGPYVAPVITVNTTDDGDDGSCTVAHCSLREAILLVNSGVAGHVEFAIPETDPGFDGTVWTIEPSPELPTITHWIHLDGTSQTAFAGDTNPDGPEIVLDGTWIGLAANGLSLASTEGQSSIVSLVIKGWPLSGVRAEDCRELSILGCYIGTDHTGAAMAPNQTGVELVGGQMHQIGTAEAGAGNVISGNVTHGVKLSGTALVLVRGNLIGIDRTGEARLFNAGSGVWIGDGAESSWIGGDGAGDGNVISGNGADGVTISGAHAQHNKVYGNWIGTQRDAAGPLGNGGHGVSVVDGSFTKIGGTEAGRANVIGGNDGDGINLDDADITTVANNRIGTEAPGGISLGNGGNGVAIHGGGAYNTIGPDNTISLNSGDGVQVHGTMTDHNTITDNSITGNEGQGISLGEVDFGNEGILAPIIRSYDDTQAEGLACSRCTVELFTDVADEGEIHQGTVTASFAGEWSWHGTRHSSIYRATATDSGGNSSEFSRCFDRREPNDDFDHAEPISTDIEYWSYVCNRVDLDVYVIEAEAGSVLTAELVVPAEYRLDLYGPDRALLDGTGTSANTELRQIVHTVTETGAYYLHVFGIDGIHVPEVEYRLTVTSEPLDADVRVFLDHGWFDNPAVFKLIPDDAGPSDATYVEVVAEVSANSVVALHPYVTVEIPGDVFGSPTYAGFRDDVESPVEWTEIFDLITVGPGRYGLEVELDAGTTPLTRQAVFLFSVTSANAPGDVVPEVDVRYGEYGDAVATATGPPIHLVRQVPAIIITSRHHLLETAYDAGDAADLLGKLTKAAQGPPDGGAGSLPAAIYYVDEYSTAAADWDNTAWDPSSEDTANVATRAIDELLDDWIDDATDVEHVLVVGDDDVVPWFRRKCPCVGRETESPTDDPTLALLVDNDYILTDNHFADTDQSGWHRGVVEVNVGRLVGDTAAELNGMLYAALQGPAYGPTPRGVLASWDGSDLHYGIGDEGVRDHVHAWGIAASDYMVDNDDWRESDLLGSLADQFTLFIHADHGSPDSICAPPSDSKSMECIEASDIAGAVDAVSTFFQRPFTGFGDCRTGFTLVSDGMIDQLVRKGISGAVGNAGISWSMSEGSEAWTEEVFNKFWRRTMPDSGAVRSVGSALRGAKLDYTPGWYWSCRDLTAVQQITLFGIPWMTIPSPSSKRSDPAAAPDREPPPVAVPKLLAADTYEVILTVDVGSYSIDTDTAPGFDLVQIDGLMQHHLDGPVLPAAALTVPLPAGSDVLSVDVVPASPVALGALNIPTYTPGVKLDPDDIPEVWEAIPPSAGTVPVQSATWAVRDLDGHLVLHIDVYPVVFEAHTRQTTLYESVVVTVAYTSPEPVAVTEFAPTTRRVAPRDMVDTVATVVNVSDASVDVTPALRVVDVFGYEVAAETASPFTVAAGETVDLAPSCPVPEAEGSYRVILEVERDAGVVATASTQIEVSAGHIEAFSAPAVVVPGRATDFSVIYANTALSAVDADVSVQVLDLAGRLEDDLGTITRTVLAGGRETVTFTWDGRSVPLGNYLLRATVVAGDRSRRTANRRVEVADDGVRRPRRRLP